MTATNDGIIHLKGRIRDGKLVALLDHEGKELGAPVTSIENEFTGGVVFSAAGEEVPAAIGPYAFAALPAASACSGIIAKVSDVGGSAGSMWISDGTRWKPLNGSVQLYVKPARATMAGVTETVLGQILVPAGVLQDDDRIELKMSFGKSGASETATAKLRVGTAGTTADSLIVSSSLLATTNISAESKLKYRRESATSIQKLGNSATFTGVEGSITTGAFPAANTVANMDSSAVYFTITGTMSSTVETFALEDFEVILRAATA